MFNLQPNLITIDRSLTGFLSGAIASGFGVAGGIFALFFFGEVPRVRKDILQHVPIIGPYFIREIPPEDNVR